MATQTTNIPPANHRVAATASQYKVKEQLTRFISCYILWEPNDPLCEN